MTQRDLAALLLSKARDDAYALSDLAVDTQTADWIVGFHAQQAVEKALKAVLTSHGVRIERTHDLTRLLTNLEESPLDVPDWLSMVRSLGPYAVVARYDEVEPDEDLDRQAVVTLVDRVLQWAHGELNQRSD